MDVYQNEKFAVPKSEGNDLKCLWICKVQIYQKRQKTRKLKKKENCNCIYGALLIFGVVALRYCRNQKYSQYQFISENNSFSIIFFEHFNKLCKSLTTLKKFFENSKKKSSIKIFEFCKF